MKPSADRCAAARSFHSLIPKDLRLSEVGVWEGIVTSLVMWLGFDMLAILPPDSTPAL